MKHKHVYNNWTHKVQNMASNLNVSRSVVFKHQWLEVCESVSVLYIVLEPYQFHTFQSCHVKSCQELYRVRSTFVKVSWQDSPPFLKKGKTLLQTFWGVEGYFHSLHSTRWWPTCCQLDSPLPETGSLHLLVERKGTVRIIIGDTTGHQASYIKRWCFTVADISADWNLNQDICYSNKGFSWLSSALQCTCQDTIFKLGHGHFHQCPFHPTINCCIDLCYWQCC